MNCDVFHMLRCIPAFTLNRQGKIQSWNAACEAATGLASAAMLGTDEVWRAFYHTPRPVAAQVVMDDLAPGDWYGQELLRDTSGVACSGLIRVDRPLPNESTIWVYAVRLDGEHGGALQIFHETSMLNSTAFNDMVQMLVDRFADPVSLVIDGRIHMANEACARLTGYPSPQALIGVEPRKLIHEADAERFEQLNANAHAGVMSGNTYRWRYNVNGNVRHVENHPTLIPWGKGKALLATSFDITDEVERKRLADEENTRLSAENDYLWERIVQERGLILGQSPAMKEVFKKAFQAAKSDSNVVIQGETGAGKSLLAQLIHDMSPRRAGKFLAVNCAAIPDHLLESEFFGHVKGAFTSAHAEQTGFFHAANGGTLFLDEVGELSQSMQTKLLHAIETRQYFPVGSTVPHSADIRIVFASNRDLVDMKERGEIREDFFYRIYVLLIRIPPLRERVADIPQLANHFLRRFGGEEGTRRFGDEELRALTTYPWPGNIRELQNVIMRYVVTNTIQFLSSAAQLPTLTAVSGDSLREALLGVERRYFEAAMEKTGGNKVKAAALLGMPLRTFHRKFSKFSILKSDTDAPAPDQT